MNKSINQDPWVASTNRIFARDITNDVSKQITEALSKFPGRFSRKDKKKAKGQMYATAYSNFILAVAFDKMDKMMSYSVDPEFS